MSSSTKLKFSLVQPRLKQGFFSDAISTAREKTTKKNSSLETRKIHAAPALSTKIKLFLDKLKTRGITQLYGFQIEAIDHIFTGKDVLVDAATGAGKTIIAEAAISHALDEKKKALYTVPLKALANDKLIEFRKIYGKDRVGIMTGDQSINPQADLLIVTTEIYNNRLHNFEFMKDIRTIIFDEAQYINHPERGKVWEESYMTTPPHIQQVSLSASIGNTDELLQWFNHVIKHKNSDRECVLVKSEDRPIPLEYQFVQKAQGKIIPAQLVPELQAQNILPCIYIYFNRNACDEEAKNFTNMINNRNAPPLLKPEEEINIRDLITEFVKLNPSLKIFKDDLAQLRLGVASHHAGKVPILKSLIEYLLDQNLIKVVFATETLASGVNKPVRTVVFSSLKKNNKGVDSYIPANNFLQISGRAGRAGLHDKGSVILLPNNRGDQAIVENHFLGRSKFVDVVSHYSMTYSSLLNFLRTKPSSHLQDHLQSSFAYFLINRFQAKQDFINEEKNHIKRGPYDRQERGFLLGLLDSQRKDLWSAKHLCQDSINVAKNIEPMLAVLSELGYIKKAAESTDQQEIVKDWQLTNKGSLCSSIRVNNPLFISELLSDENFMQGMTHEVFAALISCFVSFNYDEDEILKSGKLHTTLSNLGLGHKTSIILDKAQEMKLVPNPVNSTIPMPIYFKTKSYARILDWIKEKNPDSNFFNLIEKYNMESKPNNFINEIKEVIEFLRSIIGSDGLTNHQKTFISETIKKLDKGIVANRALVYP